MRSKETMITHNTYVVFDCLVCFISSHLWTWNDVQTDMAYNSHTDEQWLVTHRQVDSQYTTRKLLGLQLRTCKLFGVQLTESQLEDLQLLGSNFRITPDKVTMGKYFSHSMLNMKCCSYDFPPFYVFVSRFTFLSLS